MMKKEKYSLLDFKDFINCSDSSVRDMGWTMAINSMMLKDRTIDELIEIEQTVRVYDKVNKGNHGFTAYNTKRNIFLMKLNKNMQRFSSRQVENARYRYFNGREQEE